MSATSRIATDIIPSRAYDCLLLPNALPHFRELDLALFQAPRESSVLAARSSRRRPACCR